MTNTALVIRSNDNILVIEEKNVDDEMVLTIKDNDVSYHSIKLNLQQLKALVNFINHQFDEDIY